jgi:RNA polymerase sigma-70 factor (ECF subfamily)
MAAVETQGVTAPANAAAQLYERHYRRVFSYCSWRLGKREDAEDAAQTTFLNALQGLARGAQPAAEAAWLLAVAQNVCRARWRAQRRRPPELPQTPESFATLIAPESDPELLRRLQDALAELPELQRRGFVLREWEGLPYAEIATRLGTSEAAVASLVFRARRALIDGLGEDRPATRGLRRTGNVASLLGWKSLLAGSAPKLAFSGLTIAAATAVAVPVVHLSRTAQDRKPAAPARATMPSVGVPRPAAKTRSDPARAARGSVSSARQGDASTRSRAGSVATRPTPAAASEVPSTTAPAAGAPASGAPPAEAATTSVGASAPTPPPVAPPSASDADGVVKTVDDAATSVVSQLPLPTPALPQAPPVGGAPVPQPLPLAAATPSPRR